MTRLVLDAGALIAFDKGDRMLRARPVAARNASFELTTTSPVIAQVWRGHRRQLLLARLLEAVRVDAPDETRARRAGELLARTGTADVVDALVVGLARDGDTIVTSDPDDLELLVEAAKVDVRIVTV
ncbi:MAG: PIN domain-containing protein [Kofleriaceae bacterium]